MSRIPSVAVEQSTVSTQIAGALAVATTATPLPSKRTIVLERADDGLFYVDARVNDISIHFVVDTGSSVVVLNARDAARAGVGSAETMNVDTAGGATPMQRARINRVTVAGQTLTDIDAAVVGRDLPVSLLGQSALAELGSVTLKDGRIELKPRADIVTLRPRT